MTTTYTLPAGCDLDSLEALVAAVENACTSPAEEDAYNELHRALTARTVRALIAAARAAQGAGTAPVGLESVEGDLLPPVGSKVLIHLARQDAWVEHTVSGYYVWGALRHQVREGEKHAHRVFVRVKDANGYDNARLLSEVRLATPPAPVSTAAAPDGFEEAIGVWLSARDYWQDEQNENVKAAWANVLKFAATVSTAAATTASAGKWRGSLAQVILDVPLPERNDKYQFGFVDAKQAILQALRDAGFDRAPSRAADGEQGASRASGMANQAAFKTACEKRGIVPSQELFSLWQDAQSRAQSDTTGDH